MNIDNIKEFCDKQNWIYAKTYAKKAPHEYVVRDNITGTDEEFMDVVNYIQENGILDGRQYWVMRDNEDDPTTILNRCNLEEYKLSIEWIGLFE